MSVETSLGTASKNLSHIAMACSTALLLLASCGGGDGGMGQDVDAGQGSGLAALRVSSPSASDVATSSNGDQVAVFDGANEIDGRRSPTVYLANRGGEEVETFRGVDLPPLVQPLSWWNADQFFVAGLECPELQIDVLEDLGPVSSEDVCGEAAANSIYRFDPSEGTWATVVSNLPANERGIVVPYAADGPTALFGTAEGNTAKLSLVRVDTGEVVDLGPDPIADEGAREVCAMGDGSYLLTATPGPSEDGVLPITSELMATVATDRGMDDVPVEGTPTGEAPPSAPQGCTPSGSVLLGGGGSGELPLLSPQSSALERTQLPLPREFEEGDMVVVRDSTVWLGGPERGFTASFLDGGNDWRTVSGPVGGFDPPVIAEPFDGGVVAITPGSGEQSVEVYR